MPESVKLDSFNYGVIVHPYIQEICHVFPIFPKYQRKNHAGRCETYNWRGGSTNQQCWKMP